MTNIENVPTEYVTVTSAPMDGHWERLRAAWEAAALIVVG